MHGTIALLPRAADGLVEAFIDVWIANAYNEAFWQRDTAEVLDEIIASARETLRPVGLADDDEAAFNLFNIVIMNFAYNAYDQPKLRTFMKITVNSFAWLSAFALLYPILAGIYIGTTTPAGPAMVFGYGAGNLGYVLLVAGTFSGTFRILGLGRRWHVFVAAVSAILIGSLLSTLGAE